MMQFKIIFLDAFVSTLAIREALFLRTGPSSSGRTNLWKPIEKDCDPNFSIMVKSNGSSPLHLMIRPVKIGAEPSFAYVVTR